MRQAVVSILVLGTVVGCAGEGTGPSLGGDGSEAGVIDAGAGDAQPAAEAETDAEPTTPAPAPTSSCEDPDADGYGPGCQAGPDCMPMEPHANPGAEEVCFDRIDNDCDGEVDEECGCPAGDDSCTPEVEEPPPSPQTLGEFFFELSRSFMSLDPVCGDARVAALDGQRDDVVVPIDTIAQAEDAVYMGELAREVLKPLIDSGDLEATVDSGTAAVALLVDDDVDPDREALAALLALLQTETVLDRTHVLRVLERVLAERDVPSLVHAFAGLAAEPVGARSLADVTLDVVRQTASAESAIAQCQGLSLSSLGDRLLDPETLTPEGTDAQPVWVPDADAPGEVFDVQTTALPFLLQLGSDAIDAGVHRDLSLVAEAVLGETESCGEGCVRYPEDSPVADLAFTAAELLRYDETKALLDGVAVLLREQPEVAERLLVAVGHVVDRARAAELQLETEEVLDLVRELLPLLAEVFERDAQTPRLLMQALVDLGQTARDFPERLKWTIDYARLVKSPTCSDAPPNFERSTPVNYSAPRGPNNRSALGQVIELLDAVDCGRVPFSGGKTVGEFVLDTVADMRPGTVCGVTDVLLGALDVTGFLGDFVTKTALRTIGCRNASDVLRHLDSLEDLAASGALDFLIPLDKVFADRGQLDTLIAIFSLVAEDLQRDNDGRSDTHSVVRPLLPIVSELIEEGTADALFDLVDVMATVQSVDAQGRSAPLSDVLIDAVALTLRSRDVPTPDGIASNSSFAGELLTDVEGIVGRFDAPQASDAAGRLIGHVSGYLDEDGNGRLQEQAVLPVARTVMQGLSEVWQLSQAQRDCYVGGLQQDVLDVLSSPALAESVRAFGSARESVHAPELERAAVRWLAAEDPSGVRAPLMQVTAELLQTTPPSSEALRGLWPYLDQVLDPARTDGPAVIQTFDTLVQNDDDEVLLDMARRAVDQGPDGTAVAPLLTLVDAFSHPLVITPDACTPGNDPWSARGLDSAVDTLLGFLQDEKHGLPALFDALEEMAAEQP